MKHFFILFAGCNRCFLMHVNSTAVIQQDRDGTTISWLWPSVAFLAVLHRTGHIMTSGLSWGHYLCPIVFSMTRGRFFQHSASPDMNNVTPDGAESSKILCHPAGTLRSGAWTTPVVTQPCRWRTTGGWRDTSQPTSWRMRKRRGTPVPDDVTSPVGCWRQVFRTRITSSGENGHFYLAFTYRFGTMRLGWNMRVSVFRIVCVLFVHTWDVMAFSAAE